MKRVFLLFLLLLSSICNAESIIDIDDFLYMEGDDARWASADWNDQDWTPIKLYHVQHTGSVVWLRARVSMPHNLVEKGHPTGILYIALASSEIYWDGVLIGRAGKPGRTPAEEVPGPVQAHYGIPDALATPGPHIIAIRNSAHHRHFEPAHGYWYLAVGDYDVIASIGKERTLVSMLSLSCMVVVAIFAFLLFLIDRSDRSYLLLSLMACTSALLLITEAWRNLFGYTYNWHLLRLSLITALTALLNISFLCFAIVRFPGTRARWFVAASFAGICLSMLARGWDEKAMMMFMTGITLSLIWTTRAAIQRREGALLAMVGFAVTATVMLWQPSYFADMSLYFGMDFLFLCLLAAHVLQVRQVRVERQDAMLKSARLEIELLKKYIQPHYLMNTLTALTEWIEQEPKEAARMVQHLAEEFQVLSEVSHRSLISLEEELRLCNSHLEILSRRKGRSFVLNARGVEQQSMIPPAVIHTLVENAVIHNKHTTSVVEFQLKQQVEKGFTRYVLTAPLGDTSLSSTVELKEGTGTRYIKARLTENYGSRWKFLASVDGSFWKTELWIPAASG